MSGLIGRDSDFRVFWLGQTISVAGTQVTAVALPLAATLTLHSGAAGVSALATAAYVPNVVLPLVAGAWLEARRKRPAMIAADCARAAALATVPIAYFLGAFSLPLLVAVALAVGASSVVFDVAGFAFVPSLVPRGDLASANQAMQGSLTASQVGGPGAAGLIVQIAGPVVGVLFDACSYVASVLGLLAIRRAEPAVERPEQRVGITSGLAFIWRNRYLRALTVHAALYNAAFQVFTVNLVVYAIHERGLSAGLYGLALSAGGAGAFIGTMLALRAARFAGYGRAFLASLSLSTGLPLFIGIPSVDAGAFAAFAAAVMLAAGIGLGSANVLSVTLRQSLIPSRSLARANGGYRLVIFGVLPIGSALGGLIGATAGPRTGVIAGALGLAISVLPMTQRTIRQLRDPQDASNPPPLESPVLETRSLEI